MQTWGIAKERLGKLMEIESKYKKNLRNTKESLEKHMKTWGITRKTLGIRKESLGKFMET